MTDYLFVYGTLTPGHAPSCVAELVARFHIVGPATVAGKLYHCRSYPGLVLGQEGTVRGTVVRVDSDRQEDPLWRRLDAYEGYSPDSPGASLFRRVDIVATLANGQRQPCQTYVYARSTTGLAVIPTGDWFHQYTDASTATMANISASTRRPLIGITTGSADHNEYRYQIPSDYAKAIELAGGLPMMLPFRADLSLIPEFLDAVDGLLFIGGNDLNPALYGQDQHPKAVRLVEQRERFELAMIAEAERRRMPVLGVCLGSQLMNVHRGGSLIQFLPDHQPSSPIDHRDDGTGGFRHEVKLEADSKLAQAIGRDVIRVNSRHKQAVDRIGRGLRPIAWATDGTIEGVEDPSLPLFCGVQWHPENLAAEHGEHLQPFRMLVNAAVQWRKA